MEGQRTLGQFFQSECNDSDDNATQREVDDDLDRESDILTDPEDESSSSITAGPSNSVRSSTSVTDSDSTGSKRIRMDWKPAWRDKYLIDFDPSTGKMICMVCHLRMVCVHSDTVNKHFKRSHKDFKFYSSAEKKIIQLKYSREKSITKKGGQTLRRYLDPTTLVSLAPYKLAYVIAQHKKPFSDCEMCMEFALAADPSSEVFKGMSCSRRTVGRRMNDIYSYICDEIKEDVRSMLFISLMSDESMDTSVSD